ncbi:MAG: TRL-like family protein [Elusimicrobiota bacterium]|jgi:hypothetical protein|nr:TRL-like family protein [Elusimicrobiota bacterium]
MKKVIVIVFLGLVFLGFNGCILYSNEPVGLIYSNVTKASPETRVVTNNVGSKIGVSKAHSILGLVATGDYGIARAASKAGITKISSVDIQVKNIILGIYTSYTIIVTGE